MDTEGGVVPDLVAQRIASLITFDSSEDYLIYDSSDSDECDDKVNAMCGDPSNYEIFEDSSCKDKSKSTPAVKT